MPRSQGQRESCHLERRVHGLPPGIDGRDRFPRGPGRDSESTGERTGPAGDEGAACAGRRDYPTERIGVFGQVKIHNRQAQADEGIDQLTLRQTQLTTQKTLSQVQVDVSNYAVAVRQARARYQAAAQSLRLQQQLYDAEQRKLVLGASTPYNVIQQQRDLIAAQATEISALAAYSTARVALDQTLGVTLEVNHVSIGDAISGKVARPSSLPAALPAQ